MGQIMWAIFIGPIVALTLLIPLLTADWMIAQAQNATLIENQNNTRTIVNMKDRLVFLVNATSNQTIRVSNFTETIENATTNETLTTIPENATNETLTTIPENATTNETLTTIPENATTNETLTTIPENATTNNNLTAKFKELQSN